MAIHSSILACRIPWTEEPGRLQSIGLQSVRCVWSNLAWMRAHASTLWNFPLSTMKNFYNVDSIHNIEFTGSQSQQGHKNHIVGKEIEAKGEVIFSSRSQSVSDSCRWWLANRSHLEWHCWMIGQLEALMIWVWILHVQWGTDTWSICEVCRGPRWKVVVNVPSFCHPC